MIRRGCFAEWQAPPYRRVQIVANAAICTKQRSAYVWVSRPPNLLSIPVSARFDVTAYSATCSTTSGLVLQDINVSENLGFARYVEHNEVGVGCVAPFDAPLPLPSSMVLRVIKGGSPWLEPKHLSMLR